MSAIIAGLAAAIHLIVAYEVQPVLLLLAHAALTSS